MIRHNDIHKKNIEVHSPNNERVYTINNPLGFDDIRLQICKERAKGWYIVFSDGRRREISSYGALEKQDYPFEKVQKFHRKYNSHHLEYKGKYDIEAMAIDWECSRFTKTAAPLNARDTLSMEMSKHPELKEKLIPMIGVLNKYEF